MADGSTKKPIINGFEDGEYRVYRKRWLVLMCVVIANLGSGMIWMTFTNVAYYTADYYSISIDAVNWLSLTGVATHVLFGPAASWALQTYGLKFAILFGSWSMTLGSFIRVISAISVFGSSLQEGLLFLGQVILSFGTTTIALCPTVVATVWFADSERALANTLISVAQPLGIVLAGMIPPVFVVDGKLQCLTMLLVMSVPVFVASIMSSFVMRSGKPPTPPSAGEEGPKDDWWIGLAELVRDRNFIILSICTSGALGTYAVVHTLLEQILCPFGYPMDITGYSFAVLTLSGVFGAIATGFYCDKTKQFSTALKTSYVMVATGKLVICFLPFYFNMRYYVLILFAAIGMFSFGLVPIGMELAAECTYPVNVATSSGVISIAGGVQSVILVNLLEAFREEIRPNSTEYDIRCLEESYNDHLNSTVSSSSSVPIYDLRVSWYVSTGYFGFITFLLLAFFKPSYKRLNAKSESSTTTEEYTEIPGISNPNFQHKSEEE